VVNEHNVFKRILEEEKQMQKKLKIGDKVIHKDGDTVGIIEDRYVSEKTGSAIINVNNNGYIYMLRREENWELVEAGNAIEIGDKVRHIKTGLEGEVISRTLDGGKVVSIDILRDAPAYFPDCDPEEWMRIDLM